MGFWTQKRVWIIGASSGIGAGLVQLLAEKGAKLIIPARSEAKLHELEKNLATAEIQVLPVDVELLSTLFVKTQDA
ncbi:short chain dehydrogenase [Algoriphagus boritolerans DSM 17298 = JCM 18970]|uniref:Short chain dehydrogenase n=1 Tax=Algoriphagus boritolerans DSM 17298 = JCM 18970 TaxID=1120964 RepID=A0A1H5SZS7_9BACT|nr:short chain dehydrogenase [Algoriphagus boritolerans DSM 17298 = JCM 18970]